MRRTAGLLLVAVCAGCGGSSGPSKEALAELDALARGPNRAFALSTALVAPGTLLLTAADDNLLNAINMRLGTETSDCAQRTQVPGTLSVSFPPGASSGCGLASGGVTVGGTMTITIARDGATVRILDKIDLTVEGEPMTGEIVVTTDDGNQFGYVTLAALSGHTFNIPQLSGQPINATTVTNATGNTPGVGTMMRTITYVNIVERFSGCHPQAGSIHLTSPGEGIDRMITYQDNTPQNGDAIYTDGANATQVVLPSLSSCPPLPATN